MKQVIVMRTDLNMRKGKMIAQGAHASFGAIDQILNSKTNSIYNLTKKERNFLLNGLLEWSKNGNTKIVVGIDDEEKLLGLHNLAKLRKIPTYLVLDSGKTEFKGPTYTCIAIGPYNDKEVDKITGDLKLL